MVKVTVMMMIMMMMISYHYRTGFSDTHTQGIPMYHRYKTLTKS
jgi:hypothetical protein